MPLLFALLLFLGSCASQKILNVPLELAEKMLSSGDIDFILTARLKKMDELTRLDPAAPFYAGLLVDDYYQKNKEEAEAKEKADALFSSALKSPVTRNAAADKLIPGDPEFHLKDSRKAKPESLASSIPGGLWQDAFRILNEDAAGAQYSDVYKINVYNYFFVRRWANTNERKTAEWALSRMEADGLQVLSEAEAAVLKGRFSVAKRDYGPALNFFRRSIALAEASGKAGESALPDFFIAFPEALNDFGRALQYGGGLAEGIKLFSSYDAEIAEAVSAGQGASPWDTVRGGEAGAAADSANQGGLTYTRYLLNYYIGRFYRTSKNYTKAAAAFSTALSFAPDEEQSDACIWYIIDSYYGQKPETGMAQINKYASRWKDAAYFDDILDKAAFYFSSKKKWQSLLDIFPAVNTYGSASARAKFAYIIARALEEGYFKTSMDGMTPNNLFTIAYNQEADYYYRAMAAKRLKKVPAKIQFAADGEEFLKEDTAALSLDMQFLLGFFKFGCVQFVYPYITEKFAALSVQELRLLAKKLGEAGRYGDSIRLVVRYSKRPDFKLTRQDLEISYPRAFSDLVERYANKANMQQNYLYALMRTESIFIPDIVSRAGALGLTQLMPATGRQMAEILASNGGPNYIENDSINLLDPELNIHLGALYYKDMEHRMGSAQSALMAYNGGIGRVRRWRRSNRSLPDDLFAETIEITETREYSKKVIGDASIYQFLYDLPQ
ncbi:MAG: lytic transglycosylase domain-containing protein [Spirochaetaceae bacterium]|jgi:soluble lytic murein transglycosylase|nr:lytic transglycosylase domain-containing protein [Spirochaetaceae bacterium]